MKKIKGLIAIAACTTLIACSSSGGGDSTSNNADLQGTWLDSDCAYDAEQDISVSFSLTINGNAFTLSRIIDELTNDCSGTALTFVNQLGTFVVQNEVTTLPGGDAKHIDITYTKGSFTANQEYKDLLTAQGTTLEDLYAAVGVDDVNNATLAQVGIEAAMDYDIYRVDGRILRLGDSDTGDGSTPAARPTALDLSTTLLKQ